MSKAVARRVRAKSPAKEALYGVILSPVITEKATQGSAHNQVTFKVRDDASKPLIKAAVEGLFNVKVKAVNTVNLPGKTKRFRGRLGERPGYKKAMISLAEGHTIDVTTGI
jgi:large subunit ribosomal protein L23